MRNESLISGMLFFLLTYRATKRRCWLLRDGEKLQSLYDKAALLPLQLQRDVCRKPSKGPQCQGSPGAPSICLHPTCPLQLQPFPSPSDNLLMAWDPERSPSNKFFLLMEAKGIKAYEYYQLFLNNNSTIYVLVLGDERSFSWSQLLPQQDHKTILNSLLKITLWELHFLFFSIFI